MTGPLADLIHAENVARLQEAAPCWNFDCQKNRGGYCRITIGCKDHVRKIRESANERSPMHIYTVDFTSGQSTGESRYKSVYVVVQHSPCEGGLLEAIEAIPTPQDGFAVTDIGSLGPVVNAKEWQPASK